MEIVKPGIEYRLHSFKSETEYQTVRFTEKTPAGFNPGTTNEEVVSMLIDRLYALQTKNFSVENQCCIIMLKNVRTLFKKRLNRKIDRVNKYQEQNAVGDQNK